MRVGVPGPSPQKSEESIQHKPGRRPSLRVNPPSKCAPKYVKAIQREGASISTDIMDSAVWGKG